MSYLVKLVRDRVGERLGQGTVRYAPLVGRNEMVRCLRRKLVEEAIEYLEDPCGTELADVYEVMRALAVHDLRWSRGVDAVAEVAADKREKRGGFERGVVMWVDHEHDGQEAGRVAS